MPIRPENIARYPADWPALSWTIRWLRALRQAFGIWGGKTPTERDRLLLDAS